MDKRPPRPRVKNGVKLWSNVPSDGDNEMISIAGAAVVIANSDIAIAGQCHLLGRTAPVDGVVERNGAALIRL